MKQQQQNPISVLTTKQLAFQFNILHFKKKNQITPDFVCFVVTTGF